ncbi:phosphoenolpyruvate synthase [Candidatus Dependentiae bacterium]
MKLKFIKKFENISIKDIHLVGGKNASLGEMIQQLSSKGVLLPGGFAITADAYRYHLKENKIENEIQKLVSQIDKKNLKKLAQIGKKIRTLIEKSPLPKNLQIQIIKSYKELETKYGKNFSVAVRSSATAEDLPEASFAGQQETYLNITGEKHLLIACQKCFASLFTNRAISYRIDHGFNHMDIALSIGVQKMVRSDKATAGVAFTLDTESGLPNIIFINSAYGLGENVVKGTVSPDEFYVHKATLEKGFKPILKKRLGQKRKKMIYAKSTKNPTKDVIVPIKDRKVFSLTDNEILDIAKQCLIIENHYSNLKKYWVPMDIEWAKDGNDNKIYIVQARPETVHSQKKEKSIIEEYIIQKKSTKKILATGKSVGKKIAHGSAKIIDSVKDIDKIGKGDILVTDMTDPDWEPIMKIASGIVTNKGGRTCHAAIISRELGIPAIVGTTNSTKKIKNNQNITIDCASSEIGTVYDGKIPFKILKLKISKLPKLKTKIMMNVGNPDQAFNFAMLPNDGVGLARLEFIINDSIKIHPMALVEFNKLSDSKIKNKIKELTFGYKDKKEFFVTKLAQEVGTIVAAFYPKPVIVRFSDFKSNEYRKLIGGDIFEPIEENPMLGFRGASRYYNSKYSPAFKLECLAMKKIRYEMGLTNAKLMIPFVRTINEAKLVIKEMKKHGIKQSKNDFEIYMMAEIPANILLIDDFSKIFDGFSIGSNDLTQTTLAVDRDSNLVAYLFDERNAAVKKILKMAINGAKRNKKKIGICGQAPSDYPEIAQFLVKCGIDSISLTPDTILKEIMILGKKTIT